MRIKIKKYQEGGQMPAGQEPATAPQGMEQEAPAGASQEYGAEQAPEQEDPVAQLAQMAMQALQGQDCQAAMVVCQGFIEMIQQMGEGGEQAPEEAPEGEPVYRAGGKLVRRIKD